MSSRQLRKLRKQQEILNQADNDDHSGPEAKQDDNPEEVEKPRKNLFANFAALGEEADDSGVENEDDNAQQPDDDAQNPENDVEISANRAKLTKRKLRKKKKKKGKQPVEEDGKEPKGEEIDEIDRAVAELDQSSRREHTNQEESTRAGLYVTDPEANDPMLLNIRDLSDQLSELLQINFHQLKVVNEMRKMFGRETIEAIQAEETAAPRRPNAQPQEVDLETFLRSEPGKSLPEVLLRRNPFVDGKKTWPAAPAGGLSMKQMSSATDGPDTEFAFTHDEAYGILDDTFFTIVRTHSVQQLVHFLRTNPYHVSSLIQVSRIAKNQQESALAADLCERALFTFGRVTLSRFRKKLEEGKARLEFRRPENRQFWLAAYHYVKSLIMKGTTRTALEWCKLLFSLDKKDPFGILNWIHPLAIRAQEARWLLDFLGPGMFATDPIEAKSYFKQTLVLAHLMLNDKARAKAALVKGMQRLPWLYCAMFSALNLETPKSVWGNLPRNDDEDLLVHLYLHMTKDLWTNPHATALLIEVGEEIERPDLDDFLECAPVTLSTARFVYLDNTPALMAKVPRTMLHASPNFDFDPLPPSERGNIFSRAGQRLPWAELDDTSGPGDAVLNLIRGLPLALRRQVLEQLREGAAQQERAILQAQREFLERELAPEDNPEHQDADNL